MKRFLLFFMAVILFSAGANATNFSVTISGFSYTPSTLTVNVGDIVTIEASSLHPLVQVSQASWNADLNTQLSGGFSSTSNFNLTITAAMAGTTIYYVCSNHVGSGMKGQITVNVISGITENQVQTSDFTVFPNPVTTNAFLTVSLLKASKISFSIYDLSGRFVTKFIDINLQPGALTLPFDTPRLQKGVYVLQMKTSQNVIRKQIVIQ